MNISEELHQKKISTMAGLKSDRRPWWPMWRDIADYYIPKRYVWLLSDNERSRYLTKNGNISDGTGTLAGRVLAAGMMNGVTSPGRPWFRLRLANYLDDIDYAARRWLDEVERRMLLVMSESNFYNALAVMYIDLVFFGTGAMLIYEDAESVIRCYNSALGEYYLGQSPRLQVNIFAREISYKVHQMVDKWGLENCSDRVKNRYEVGGAARQEDIQITHLIEANDYNIVSKKFEYAECYWETAGTKGQLLSANGFNELPGIFPRWELTGNDSYGTSPGMDALGDVIQLQHETKRKGQSLDYMVRPPMVLDVQLQHRPTALMPGGQTFVSGQNNVGAKPAYEVHPPIAELSQDLRDIQIRIREIFNNDLFKQFSQLETVRTAAEINVRREEQLVQLGPVLERFENEALDPAINRIYEIMARAGLIPAAPPSIHDAHLEIQYVSVLSTAQTAVGVIPTERFLQLVGSMAAVYPKALNIPNFEELIRDYAVDIGVKAKGINTREETQALNDAQDQEAAAAKGLSAVNSGADSAKLLSQTDVGGGSNALQQILGRG